MSVNDTMPPSSSTKAPIIMERIMDTALPLIMIFGLDYTLWPFEVAANVTPPFHKASFGEIFDKNGKHIECYDEVPLVFEKLKKDGVKMGLASNTTTKKEAEDLLELFGWNQYFTYKEIYPGSRVPHVQRIIKESGVNESDILFFDYDFDARNEVHYKLGVQSFLTLFGMNFNILNLGISRYQVRNLVV